MDDCDPHDNQGEDAANAAQHDSQNIIYDEVETNTPSVLIWREMDLN